MSTKKRLYSRIAITLPPEVLQAADALALRMDRSRSWVIAEAVRQFASRPPNARARAAGVAEPAAGYTAELQAGLGPSRLAQLEADLRMTPEQRVLAAEETARLDEVRGKTGAIQWLLFFDRAEDYLEWKKREMHFP